MRILTATNTQLPEAIRQGRFREDLYYRLNVIEIAVPPLAERRDDILPLARHFLEPGFEFTADAERALLRHDWPGNVRELVNSVRRAALLAADRRIGRDELMLPSSSETGAVPVRRTGPRRDRVSPRAVRGSGRPRRS